MNLVRDICLLGLCEGRMGKIGARGVMVGKDLVRLFIGYELVGVL